MEIEFNTVICDSSSATVIRNSSFTTTGYRLPPPLTTVIRDCSSATTSYPLQTHTFRATNLSSSTTTNLSFSKIAVSTDGLNEGLAVGGVFGAGVVGMEVGFVGGGEGCIEAVGAGIFVRCCRLLVSPTAHWVMADSLLQLIFLLLFSGLFYACSKCFLGSCVMAIAILLAVCTFWFPCFHLLGGIPCLFRVMLSFAEYRKMVEKFYKPPSA
ncbi:hypothetical protein Pint_25561 [Pistacia integerrima]|uniref:Uncharacterized protein n=1 Tax=Pistacia integerrima TaxID=434235 RepID=A0ACC0YFN2_9ROSI|nr:hypothetical protein Pint_25561 [Pistacia integerrima]